MEAAVQAAITTEANQAKEPGSDIGVHHDRRAQTEASL